MSGLNSWCAPRLIHAYLTMAEKAKYRPAAPSDGLGNIQLPPAELADRDRLVKEACLYAEGFRKEEDSREFRIGCAGGTGLMALVYIIEAARCLCAEDRPRAKRLLKLALTEMSNRSGDSLGGSTVDWRRFVAACYSGEDRTAIRLKTAPVVLAEPRGSMLP